MWTYSQWIKCSSCITHIPVRIFRWNCGFFDFCSFPMHILDGVVIHDFSDNKKESISVISVIVFPFFLRSHFFFVELFKDRCERSLHERLDHLSRRRSSMTKTQRARRRHKNICRSRLRRAKAYMHACRHKSWKQECFLFRAKRHRKLSCCHCHYCCCCGCCILITMWRTLVVFCCLLFI